MSVLTVAPVLPDVVEDVTLNDDTIMGIVRDEKTEVLKGDTRARGSVRAWSFQGNVD
jgi:hypothetical protein